MKKTMLILLSFAMSGLIISSCSKDDNNDNNDDNKIPDAVFEMNVTGAESHSLNFTLDKGTATDHGIIGSFLASQNLVSINVTTLPTTWMFTIFADMNSMGEGSYDIKTGMSAFSNPDQTASYLAASGTLNVTKATSFEDVGWYTEGTFNGTYEDTSTPPNQVSISGSFSGVYIGKELY